MTEKITQWLKKRCNVHTVTITDYYEETGEPIECVWEIYERPVFGWPTIVFVTKNGARKSIRRYEQALIVALQCGHNIETKTTYPTT